MGEKILLLWNGNYLYFNNLTVYFNQKSFSCFFMYIGLFKLSFVKNR